MIPLKARCGGWGALALLATLALSLLAACLTGREALADLVASEAEAFDAGGLPTGLLDDLEAVSVVFVGETHYVAEHQAFLADLALGLQPQGFQLVLQEGMYCDGWAADDFVQGSLAELPENVAAFDRLWLERLRKANAALAPDERIHVAYFDMNHFPEEFDTSLRLALGLSRSARLEELASAVLARGSADPGYAEALGTFKVAMESQPEGLDAKWARRLAQSAAIELQSLVIRNLWSDEGRESIIFENVATMVARAPEGKAIVNCGMNHAQKLAALPGPKLDYLRARMAELPEFAMGGRRLFSLAAAPLAGLRIEHFYDKAEKRFDLLTGTSDRNILRLMGEAAQGRSCYLPLRSTLLMSSSIPWADGISSLAFPVGAVFDGLITYPRATVPESLGLFRR